MRRPVIARKATTQMTRNKAGIIGQQVYLSCARCNAKRAGFLYFPAPARGRTSLALRRMAALRGFMPRLSALSIAEMRALISLAGASALAARLLNVRTRLKTRRLRSARRSVWRARLAADFVLAMRSKKYGRERHGCAPICQP